MSTDPSWDGPERRNGESRRKEDRIHPMRWRLLSIWILIFTIVVGVALKQGFELGRQNKERIHEVQVTGAKLKALQRTNCGLTVFLLTARKARWDSYKRGHNKADLEAVIGYEKLAAPFLIDKNSTGVCPVPKRIIIPSRPLGRG